VLRCVKLAGILNRWELGNSDHDFVSLVQDCKILIRSSFK
jgi:hypothetical protein